MFLAFFVFLRIKIGGEIMSIRILITCLVDDLHEVNYCFYYGSCVVFLMIRNTSVKRMGQDMSEARKSITYLLLYWSIPSLLVLTVFASFWSYHMVMFGCTLVDSIVLLHVFKVWFWPKVKLFILFLLWVGNAWLLYFAIGYLLLSVFVYLYS